MFKTTDGGATWTPSGLEVFNRFVRAIAIDPTTPTAVYAAACNEALQVHRRWSDMESQPRDRWFRHPGARD